MARAICSVAWLGSGAFRKFRVFFGWLSSPWQAEAAEDVTMSNVLDVHAAFSLYCMYMYNGSCNLNVEMAGLVSRCVPTSVMGQWFGGAPCFVATAKSNGSQWAHQMRISFDCCRLEFEGPGPKCGLDVHVWSTECLVQFSRGISNTQCSVAAARYSTTSTDHMCSLHLRSSLGLCRISTEQLFHIYVRAYMYRTLHIGHGRLPAPQQDECKVQGKSRTAHAWKRSWELLNPVLSRPLIKCVQRILRPWR